jgi:hypothetical protein
MAVSGPFGGPCMEQVLKRVRSLTRIACMAREPPALLAILVQAPIPSFHSWDSRLAWCGLRVLREQRLGPLKTATPSLELVTHSTGDGERNG